MSESPFVSPEDREVLERCGLLDGDWSSKLPDDDESALRFLQRFDSRRIVFDRLPDPFVGRPFCVRNGRRFAVQVVFLLVNPGLEIWRFLDEDGENRRRKNLAGEAGFFFLKPSLATTGGGKWWRKKLKAIAKCIAMRNSWLNERRNPDIQMAYHWMAEEGSMFACDWFPYRSKKKPKEMELVGSKLASTAAICDLVKALYEAGSLFVVLVGSLEHTLGRFRLDDLALQQNNRVFPIINNNVRGWLPPDESEEAHQIATGIIAND